ncbi:uncharacterized protein LOC143151294 [Ptiloglossa arizonensis]|uniref:uncharacterized protein LOC143151294 n=1 Tax=Ptiloglossa arizonensis TaxID=3350558 RepID=UPI003FA1219B
MKSSILNTLFVLTVAHLLIVQAEQDCACGGLGSGKNPCTCSETVVQAAKLPTPTYYISPQDINNAALTNDNAVTSTGTSSNAHFISQSISNPIVYSNSKPIVYSNDVPIAYRNNPKTYSSNNFLSSRILPITYTETVSVPETFSRSNSGCGCNKPTSEALENRESINFNGNIVPRFPPIGDLCYPLPDSHSGKLIEKTRVTPAYPGKITCNPPTPYEICINTHNGDIVSRTEPGTFTGSRSALGLFGELKSGNHGLPPVVYARAKSASEQKQYAGISISSSSSDRFEDDTDETRIDYPYSETPADAVSLTLAYKNLRAPNVIYRQGKQFVPEDKLSFGHRTVPNDAINQNKKVPDIPEEKLVTVEKPIVELKLAPPRTVVIGSYDEREEAKLAELEAIERESITQEETVDHMAESLLTYKDLGYAPVGISYSRSSKNDEIINGEINDSAEVPCGPLGPPIPDYIPGSVIVQQQVAGDYFGNPRIGDITETIDIRQTIL